MMCFKDPEAKLAVWNCSAAKDLLYHLRKTNDEKLLWTASRLVKVLSTCPHNKESIVEAGGFYMVAERMKQAEEKSKHDLFKNFLVTLRNLSDADANFVSRNGFIMSYNIK